MVRQGVDAVDHAAHPCRLLGQFRREDPRVDGCHHARQVDDPIQHAHAEIGKCGEVIRRKAGQDGSAGISSGVGVVFDIMVTRMKTGQSV